MPLYIKQSGDLVRCRGCQTDRQTLKDRATELLIKYKSGALVTQFKSFHVRVPLESEQFWRIMSAWCVYRWWNKIIRCILRGGSHPMNFSLSIKECNTKTACVQYALYGQYMMVYSYRWNFPWNLRYLVELPAESIGRARVSYRGWKWSLTWRLIWRHCSLLNVFEGDTVGYYQHYGQRADLGKRLSQGLPASA